MSEGNAAPVDGTREGSSGTMVLISLAAAVIVLIGLGRISSIVGPVFLALILTLCAYPRKQRLMARGVPTAVAALATILAVYAMIGALVVSLWVSAGQRHDYWLRRAVPAVARDAHGHRRQLLPHDSRRHEAETSPGGGGFGQLRTPVQVLYDHDDYFRCHRCRAEPHPAPCAGWCPAQASGHCWPAGLLAGGLPSFIAVVAFYGIINSLIQSVIQHKFVAGSVNLNMTLTFLSVIFWSALLGPLGALMAIPLSSFARAILVDDPPQSARLRPFIRDISEAKEMLPAQRQTAKAAKARRAVK